MRCARFYLGLIVLAGSSAAFTTAANSQDGELPKFALFKLEEHSEPGDMNSVYDLSFSLDGRYLAARTRDHVVHVYDLISRSIVAQIDGHDGYVKFMQFSPTSNVLVTGANGTEDEQIKIWDPATGNLLKAIDGQVEQARFSEDGKHLTVINESVRRVIDLESGRELVRVSLSLRGEQVLGVTPDRQTMAVYRSARRENFYPVRIVDSKNRGELQLVGVSARPKRVYFSQNTMYAAATYVRQNDAFCWEMEKGTKKFKISGHSNQIEAIHFSPDSRWLTSASWDQTAKIWDVVSGRTVQTLYGHASKVCSVAYSNDGRLLATGSSGENDCSIIVWDLEQSLLSKAADIAHLTGLEFEKLWDSLGEKDPAIALGAVSVLRDHFIDHREAIHGKVMESLDVLEQQEIMQLISDLESPEYATRQAAFRKLKQIRPIAENALREVLKTTQSAEVRIRVKQLLAMPLRKPKISKEDYYRLHRIVYLLELVDNPVARDLLKQISLGHMHVEIARAATHSLQRIEHQADSKQKDSEAN